MAGTQPWADINKLMQDVDGPLLKEQIHVLGSIIDALHKGMVVPTLPEYETPEEVAEMLEGFEMWVDDIAYYLHDVLGKDTLFPDPDKEWK